MLCGGPMYLGSQGRGSDPVTCPKCDTSMIYRRTTKVGKVYVCPKCSFELTRKEI